MNIKAIVGKNFLRIGDSGPMVEAFQLGLRDCGYALRGTGFFANATDTAVRAFQKRAGLKVDGVVGADTAGAIDLARTGTLPGPIVSKIEIGRPLWVEAGIPLIGLREGVGAKDNQEIIDWAKDEGGEIAKEYTHDSIPWCALFANHLLTKCTLPGTESLWALDFEGHWPSKRLAAIAVGAFCPMVRDGGGHIICVVGKAANGNIMGLGGNQHDSVSIAEFAPSRLNRGSWWPESVALPLSIGTNLLPIIKSNGQISMHEA